MARMKLHHIVKARKRLPGPPLRMPLPMETYRAVPIVPPMPLALLERL